MKKYITSACRWGVVARINEIEIDKESQSYVWIKGRREAKETHHFIYHDTWDAAKEFLYKEAEKFVDRHKIALKKAQIDLSDVQGLEA